MLDQDTADLSYLVSLCLSRIRLKVDQLRNGRVLEQVMAASHMLIESEAFQRHAEVGESNSGV